mgnify:CR=1 FL=1
MRSPRSMAGACENADGRRRYGGDALQSPIAPEPEPPQFSAEAIIGACPHHHGRASGRRRHATRSTRRQEAWKNHSRSPVPREYYSQHTRARSNTFVGVDLGHTDSMEPEFSRRVCWAQRKTTGRAMADGGGNSFMAFVLGGVVVVLVIIRHRDVQRRQFRRRQHQHRQIEVPKVTKYWRCPATDTASKFASSATAAGTTQPLSRW